MKDQKATGEDRMLTADNGKRRWLFGIGIAVGLTGLMSTTAYAQPTPQQQPVLPLSAPTTVEPADGGIRQTEAEAVAAAKATGKRVEIGSFRGERREVWANPDGTFTEIHHQQPFRTVQDGKWVPVDSTLVRRPDGTIVPKAAAIELSFSGGGDGPFATIERAGRSMSLTWPGWLPEPVLDGDTAIYAEVLPSVDLLVRATVTGFAHILVVKTREAAEQPGVREVALGLTTNNVTLRDKGEGRLVAEDSATGGEVFEAPSPIMWDSGSPEPAQAQAQESLSEEHPSRVPPETARRAPLQVRVEDQQLVLTPDPAMLADPETRFPVYIDPFVNGTSNTAWAMVDSGYPDEKYWKFDGKAHERIGLCPSDCGRNSKVKRLLSVSE